MKILHVAPHPDDELLGAPATLFALRDVGHQISNLAVSLGRPNQHQRRRLELQEACRRAGFQLLLLREPLAISKNDNLIRAQAQLTAMLGGLFKKAQFDIVVSPSPHDGHYAHELVGRATREAIEKADHHPRWWMWGLWSELPLPTTLLPFGDKRLQEILDSLEAHVGELTRNDYRRLLHGRAQMTSIIGPEKVFGFGHGGIGAAYGEVTMEAVYDGDWHLGKERLLDPIDPLPSPSHIELDWWLDSISVLQQKELFIGRESPWD
jgi:LmbE family N-acetylglucosaminyl deacetylase